MSGYVTRIRTTSGDLQIDYNALANLPDKPTLKDLGVDASQEELNNMVGTTNPVQDQINDKLNKAGDTMSGVLNMANNSIIGLLTSASPDAAATVGYVNSAGLVFCGALADDIDNKNIEQGIYTIQNVQGIDKGLLFHRQIIHGELMTQTLISSDASQIWVRTCYDGTWSKFRYIGFGYGTESEMPQNAQDGQLFFVKVQ